VAAWSVLLFMLLVGSTLAHRGRNLHDFYDMQTVHVNHMNNATVADECAGWCTRKVENPRTNPDGSIQDTEKCTKDENGQPWNDRCTWNIVCGYNSGKCKACSQCKPTVEKTIVADECPGWCTRKVENPRKNLDGSIQDTEKCTTDEKGQPWNDRCTWNIVCGYNSGKCKACPQCTVPTTKNNVPEQTGCEEWCAGKIGQKKCDGNTTICTWGKICTWSSGKCSKCSQCPMADPTCSLGVRSNLGGNMKPVCCKHTCGSHCGGADCAKKGGDSADCCGEKILSARKSCTANLPPCVLENQNGRKNDSNRVKTLLGLGWAILMALAAAA